MSTWMVVEDEPDIYEVLLAMFGIWGIEGVAFVDGEEAVSWIDDVDSHRFQGELPELALLDIRLPGKIDGPQVGERLRQSSILKDIAIVLTTAYQLSLEDEQRVIKLADADRLIYKPLPKFGALQTLLETTITERRTATAKAAEVKVKVEIKPAKPEVKIVPEVEVKVAVEPKVIPKAAVIPTLAQAAETKPHVAAKPDSTSKPTTDPVSTTQSAPKKEATIKTTDATDITETSDTTDTSKTSDTPNDSDSDDAIDKKIVRNNR